jgi:hypothetical protein
MEPDFYRRLLKTAWRLTGQSAFVRSGALWSPFPLLVSVVFLAFIVAFLFVFARTSVTTGTRALTWELLRATFWAFVAGFAALIIAFGSTFLFEAIVYAPSVVMQQAAENPLWEVRERYWTSGVKLGQTFRTICAEGPIRIMDAPDCVPESAYLYGFLRSVAQTEGCTIANDQQDLNRQPDVDRPAHFRAGITIHASPSHRMEADQMLMVLNSMAPPTGWHFERGSGMLKGTKPGTIIAIELGRTLRLP